MFEDIAMITTLASINMLALFMCDIGRSGQKETTGIMSRMSIEMNNVRIGKSMDA